MLSLYTQARWFSPSLSLVTSSLSFIPLLSLPPQHRSSSVRQLTKALLLSRKKKNKNYHISLKNSNSFTKDTSKDSWKNPLLAETRITLELHLPHTFGFPSRTTAGQQGRTAGQGRSADSRRGRRTRSRPTAPTSARSAPLCSAPFPAVPPPPLSAAPRPTGLPPFPSGSREAYRSRCPHTDTPTAAAPPSARRKRPPTPQPSAALPARLRPLLGAHRGAERRRRGVGPRAPPGGRRPRGVKAAGAAAERGPLGWAVALGLAGRCACSPKKMCNKVAPEWRHPSNLKVHWGCKVSK